MKGRTISDWIIHLGKDGLSKKLHSVKLEDNKRLKESGLPVYADFQTSRSQFTPDNSRLAEFMMRYSGFVVRALPRTSNLPRRYKIGIHDFNEASGFLRKQIASGDEDKYDVMISEYENSIASGAIRLTDSLALVEVSRAGLDRLSHGQAKVFGGVFGMTESKNFRGINFYRTYQSKAPRMMINLMYRALKSISDASLLWDEGYFEFVLTKSLKLRFIDFKIQEGYRVPIF